MGVRVLMASTTIALSGRIETANAACATQYCWTAGAGTWSTAADWSPAAAPTAGNIVTINNGATVTVDTAVSSGNTVIDGSSTTIVSAGASWTNNGSSPGFNQPGGAIIVGQTGTGSLVVDNGGTVSTIGTPSGSVVIGNLAGSTGSIIVGDGGAGTASFTNNPPPGYEGNLNIGYAGNGSLTVNANGIVSGFSGATIGIQAGSQGTLTVNGGSFSTPLGSLDVGQNGRGTLLIENGGTASVLQAVIGGGVGSNGSSATVTGRGSAWTVTGSISLGNAGDASLNISDGAVFTLAPYLNTRSQVYAGYGSANASIVVDGGTLNAAAAELLLGGSGAGQATMVIKNGGSVSNSGVSYIGDPASPGAIATGIVTLTGAGSNWTAGTIIIANSGTHTSLSVDDGASLTSGEAIIGYSAISGNNAVTVSGAGTSWQSGAILIGNVYNAGNGGGTGSLSVAGGAHISASGNIDIGYSGDGGNGIVDTMTVDGTGSKVASSGNLRVGYFGTGTMTISNGAVVSNGEGSIGYSSTNASASSTLFLTTATAVSVGDVLVTGTGSTWSNTSLIVGDNAAITGYAGTGTGTATGTLTIADGGTVTSTNPVVVAANAGASGTINIGAALGQAAAAPGTLVAPAIQFGAGTGAIVFNHTGSNYLFDAPISGNGRVDLESGTTILTGASTYTGATLVNGGTLNVAGSLSGTSGVTVRQGGTLTGLGTIASPQVLIGSGATFAPGAPTTPGTAMTLTGNLGFEAGATYAVYLKPASGTAANVSGTAALNGTVAAYFLPGSYISKTYDILHSASLGGTAFSGFTVSPTNFKADLGYDTSDVYLNLTAQMGTGNDLTGNQRHVANALNRFFNDGGALPPAFATIFTMTGSALGNALAQASGQAGTGAAPSALQLDSQFINLLLDHTFDTGPVASTGDHSLGFAAETSAHIMPDAASAFARMEARSEQIARAEPHWNIWGAAFGGSQSSGGDPGTGAGGTQTGTYGLATGAEYRLTPDSLFGVALAGGSANWRLSDGLGSGNSNSILAGIYGSTWFGPAYVASSMTLSNHWFSTGRNVLGSQLTGSFMGESYGAKLEGGYRIDAHPMLAVTPYWSLQLQDGHVQAYRESSAGSFGLAYASSNLTDIRTELGVRLESRQFMMGAPLILSGKLAWAHDSLGTIASSAAFQALPGSDFIVNGTPSPTDAALVTARAQWQVADHWSIAAQIHTESASNAQSYGGTGEVRFAW